MSMAQIPGTKIVDFVGLLSIVIYISGVFIFLVRFLYMSLHSFREPDQKQPFRMKAKKDGQCAECEFDIFEGDDIIYDPKEYKAYCISCGEELL